jgi:hypothetical protein
MNSLLPRGVPKREQLMPYRQANDAKIRLIADLIGIDSAFEPAISSWLWKTSPWAGFSANS